MHQEGGARLPSVVEVADFRTEDQVEVRALILAGLGEHWGGVDEGLNPDLEDIRATYGHGRTVVVRSAGAIVGTGTIVPRDGSTAEILRRSVATGHRRAGLGRLIVEELLAAGRAWGATAVILETTSHWDDVLAFYRSCGFEITHHEIGPFGEDTWFRREVLQT